MSLSSCDIDNPAYGVHKEPVFDRTKFTDIIIDDEANELPVEVEYHYYEVDRQRRVVFAQVKPLKTYYATELSIVQSVIELMYLHDGSIVMECNVKVLDI